MYCNLYWKWIYEFFKKGKSYYYSIDICNNIKNKIMLWFSCDLLFKLLVKISWNILNLKYWNNIIFFVVV